MSFDLPMVCPTCGHNGLPSETRRVRSNVRRLRERTFDVWRCASCASLHCEKVDDLPGYYQYYPIRNERLDYFWRIWCGVILKRLVKAGLKPEHRILDYGCNTGLFLRFLKAKGYAHCFGYDPYVEEFKSTDVLKTRYDVVVSLDVIEHDVHQQEFLGRISGILKEGGVACIETPNAAGIKLDQTEEYLHALHMPYHVHILSQEGLLRLAREQGLEQVAVYNQWYMNSWLPGTSRHLAEKLLMFSGNDIDSAYEPPRVDLFFKHPSLMVYLFFGYFLPPRKNDHMMLIFRKA